MAQPLAVHFTATKVQIIIDKLKNINETENHQQGPSSFENREALHSVEEEKRGRLSAKM